MSKHVLIADDSMVMRRLIAESLTEDGWVVVGQAEDGVEAVELYKHLRPDAVTLDIVMPELDGIEALSEIMKFDPHACVVMVSALNQTRLVAEAIRAGAQDFIAKPFTVEQLQQTMGIAAEAVLEAVCV